MGTNLELLKDTIKESGIKMGVLAKKLEIESHTLNRRLKGESEFTVSEVRKLTEALHLDAETRRNIFLF